MKRVNNKGYKRRVTLLSVVTIPLLVVFVSTFSYWIEGYKYKKDAAILKEQLEEKLEAEEELKSQISKLQNPEYVAKYAREKYMYSKDGEIIIRIED